MLRQPAPPSMSSSDNNTAVEFIPALNATEVSQVASLTAPADATATAAAVAMEIADVNRSQLPMIFPPDNLRESESTSVLSSTIGTQPQLHTKVQQQEEQIQHQVSINDSVTRSNVPADNNIKSIPDNSHIYNNVNSYITESIMAHSGSNGIVDSTNIDKNMTNNASGINNNDNNNSSCNELSWHSYFLMLQAHLANTGSLELKSNSNPPLEACVLKQRQQNLNSENNTKSELTKERRMLLDALHFDWNLTDKNSTSTIATPHQQQNEISSSSPSTIPVTPGQPASAHVSTTTKPESVATTTLTTLLSSASPPPRDDEQKWQYRLNQLRLYKEIHGHPNVSETFKNYIDLGKWVTQQRAKFHKETLTHKQLEALASIGFDFTPGDKKVPFEVRLDQLREYRATHGDVRVPRK